MGLPRVGVLAVQGDFEAHLRLLEGRAEAWEVKTPADLDANGGVEGILLPGGESTTMIRLLRLAGLWEELKRRGEAGLSMFGTCAGAILLSREVERDARGRRQDSLGLLDATIRRNAYGRQVESFEQELPCPLLDAPIPVICIRAPRFLRVGSGVEVLLTHKTEALWVRQGRIWAATFHPELTGDGRVHEAFLGSIHSNC